VPIVCIKYEDKCYVLDGHARSLRANQLGLRDIQAMVLSPEREVEYGIVKTAKEMHLRSLKDIQIEN